MCYGKHCTAGNCYLPAWQNCMNQALLSGVSAGFELPSPFLHCKCELHKDGQSPVYPRGSEIPQCPVWIHSWLLLAPPLQEQHGAPEGQHGTLGTASEVNSRFPGGWGVVAAAPGAPGLGKRGSSAGQGRAWLHRHSSGERRSESSSSPSGMRGSSAERVSPQNRGGDSSFLVAVNFQPMWLPQIRHWAMVQAYPGNQLCSVEGLPLRLRLEALYTVRVSWMYPWGFT